MATRSEVARSSASKKGTSKKKARKIAQRKPRGEHHEAKSAAKNASYEKDSPGTKRPSRKSTRAGKNRSKPDTAQVATSEYKKISPNERARSSKRKAQRVRGSSTKG